MTFRARAIAFTLLTAALSSAAPARTAAVPTYDTLLKGGTIYDGMGGAAVVGDVAIRGDRIVYVGPKAPGTARNTVDAKGLAVAPGFINMLSWAVESLIADGRGLSDIRQGVTLEVFGEGDSFGPMTPEMKRLAVDRQSDVKYPIAWNSLAEYLDWLTKRGIAPNVASFIGATTVRANVLGEEDIDPTPAQVLQMRGLVAKAMRDGAIGVGSSLIYAPASYAETPELIALVDEVGRCDGLYISHMRSEGDRLIEAIDELIEISRKTGARAEIYHFKQAGKDNWPKIDAAIARVEAARKAGLKITADMYPYTIAGSGLDASMPTWVQSGGLEKWIERMKDPKIRARLVDEIGKPGIGWENMYLASGGADGLIAVGFKSEKLKPLTGKTITEIAAMRHTSPIETMMDLVIEDGSRVGIIYRIMDEANVARAVALPWMSFGSDADAQAPEGPFLKSRPHPRAYGTFARVVGHYARDEGRMPMAEAIRRMTSLPAANLGIRERGRLATGYHADIAVFDPKTFVDRATVQQPQAFATGMQSVYVNGKAVLLNGEPTANRPGQVVRGPGWTGWPGGGACRKR
ncbi:N-acyl-D-amino-acid deacylase family protein [Sphingomonas sp.]|uniref:N-acyl-D-amino-acid deacylase family protein n=1 Tax=Sphingomonas sp. TaxID=28214 RepID=UPI003D6C7273